MAFSTCWTGTGNVSIPKAILLAFLLAATGMTTLNTVTLSHLVDGFDTTFIRFGFVVEGVVETPSGWWTKYQPDVFTMKRK